MLGAGLPSHAAGHPHRLPLPVEGSPVRRRGRGKTRPDLNLFSHDDSLLDSLPPVGSLGWLDTGGDLCRPGPPVGGHHVPGLPLQAEGQAGGGAHQALGPRGQPGECQGTVLTQRKATTCLFQVRAAIFEEMNGIAPRKPYGYDNQAISAY